MNVLLLAVAMARDLPPVPDEVPPTPDAGSNGWVLFVAVLCGVFVLCLAAGELVKWIKKRQRRKKRRNAVRNAPIFLQSPTQFPLPSDGERAKPRPDNILPPTPPT